MLNTNQQRAVESKGSSPWAHTAPETIVIAGPGSGKSHTLIQRIVQEHFDGADHSRTVAITFTNAGANELAKRLDEYGIKLGFNGTIHGYLFRLLNQHGAAVGYCPGGITILDPETAGSLLEYTKKKLGSKISKKEIDAGESREAKRVLGEHWFTMKHANCIDYDRILSEGLKLLGLCAIQNLLSIYRLYVDEAQDSGALDWQIYDAIPAAEKFFVGDPDQSIFGFRGARPDMLTKRAVYVDPILLEINYRSDVEVCAAANALIGCNQDRIEKACVPESVNRGEVYGVLCASPEDEIHEIVGRIDRAALNETAILCRYNKTAEQIKEALKAAGIPIKRRIATDMPADWPFAVACIGAIKDPHNDMAFGRFLVTKGESPAKVRSDNLSARAGRESLYEYSGFTAIEHQPGPLKRLLGKLDLLGVSLESLEIIDQRIALILDDNLSDLLVDLWNPSAWSEEQIGDGVTVGTIHSVKGQEFDNVFIAGVEDEIFPGTGDVEESRRLLFVGMTRARHNLIITHARTRTIYGPSKPATHSRFLAEIFAKCP